MHRSEALANLSTPATSLVRMANSGKLQALLAGPVRGERRSIASQRRLTEMDRTDLVASYRTGRTVDELAVAFEINRQTVMKHLRDAGVIMRNVIQEHELMEALKLAETGLSANQIGIRLRRDPKTIRSVLARAQLQNV
ncbi:MAG: hypothetical protein B5766_00695 [Candidatus Lumbricidophila eiseniae]|uniref:Uncharacterized protein n=1 Tax=Candidatus Lumbricidiphila eiseniae TaxID=1969409 RepID=A0A2A6FUV8_9MICO|nr:MAG: hypothetical protein B5766_00695 [Candidatus Lumbricidophila eiseniae]